MSEKGGDGTVSEKGLPVVRGEGPETPSGEERAAPGPPPVRLESSSVRLVGTLAAAGAVAGLAIVLTYQWANPRIEAWRAEVLSEAVTEVLAGAESYETVFVERGALTAAPAGDTAGLDRIYVGYDRDANRVGVALVGDGTGFQDVVRVIFGYDPATAEVIGMRVLESKETPGLGDKIVRDSAFVAAFLRVAVPIVGVRAGRAGGAKSEVVMITGATISAQAVVDIINARLDRVGDAVDMYWRRTARSAVDAAEGVDAVEGVDRADAAEAHEAVGAADAAETHETVDARKTGPLARGGPGGSP